MDILNDSKKIASLIDHTFLKANAQFSDLKAVCEESKKYSFCSVAVNPQSVPFCVAQLSDSSVKVGAAIGFPLGQSTIDTKEFETKQAIKLGAGEIDYMINITQLKEKNYSYIEDEMRSIVVQCRMNQIVVKVIFENCFLTDDEKKRLCQIALKIRPDFIKTSTGFGTLGATLEDVKLMKSCVGDEIKVKASGGIKNWAQFQSFIRLGVERIGTSSSVKIVEEYLSEQKV